jgi:FkbM family methyltransferase
LGDDALAVSSPRAFDGHAAASGDARAHALVLFSGGGQVSAVVPTARFAAAKSRLAKALCHPWVGAALGRWYHDEIPDRRGCTIRTPAPVAPYVKALLFWGLYESGEVRFVRQYLRRDLDVVELGASIGVVGSHVARGLEPGRRLICLEANPRLVPLLEKNVRLNAPGVALAVVNAAISYAGEPVVELTLGESNLAGAVGRQGTERVRVPATTLSSIVRDHQLREYCLVSDIEGAEGGLIRHDAAALEGCRQIIIELHEAQVDGRQLSPAELAAALVAIGYQARAQYGPVYVFERP